MAQPVDSTRNCFLLSDYAIKKAISKIVESNVNIPKFPNNFTSQFPLTILIRKMI